MPPAAHPLLGVAVEAHRLDGGAPAPELVQPVVQRGLWHDDHVGAVDAAELVQVGQQADGLQRLAQALRVGGSSGAQGQCCCKACLGQLAALLCTACTVKQWQQPSQHISSSMCRQCAFHCRMHHHQQQQAGRQYHHDAQPQQQAGRQAAHHLVCQDAVDAVVVQVDHPVETLQLVLTHGAAGDDGRLDLWGGRGAGTGEGRQQQCRQQCKR